ncbi:ribosomal protein S5, C-terminal domain-containing protein [Gorgonomyces haynaldii]|nr:ribosomal protein S5, C-terminal domain-containing protein [Gorgonomyces haynaldii]
MVVVGDQHGNAGVGMGRGPDTPSAIRKATEIAQKKMVFVPRLDNRTIYSDVNMKFHNVNIELRSAKPGHGLVANNYIHEICRCAGIADLTAKVRGSLNPMNVVNATFAALLNQQNPQKIAQQRGKKLIDVEKTYYGSRL